MKTLVISDVHGMTFWKDIVSNLGPADHAVFLGDYFDKRGDGPYADSQTENFLEICALAKSNPNVHLLIGNHDFQYTPWDPVGTSSLNEQKTGEYRKALMDNMHLLNIIHTGYHMGKPVIYSHAGLTQNFMDAMDIPSVEAVNQRFREYPEEFNFIESFKGEPADWHGDNIWQSPLWIRPASLRKGAVQGYDQVVGHTPTNEVIMELSDHGDELFFTCTFNSEYLAIE